MIEIGLCCDEGYAMPCGVCITSIFESNPDAKFRIHILTNGLSEETKRRLDKTAQRYGQMIEIYDIDSSLLDGVHIPESSHFTIMAYARLLFARILDAKIERLIYLDCDIIVVGNLMELWKHNINDYALGAVPDSSADSIIIHNRIEVYGYTYVNSGVLLLNLPKWRDDNIGERCIEYTVKHPDRCPFVDQDAINAVLYDKIDLLHFKYNFKNIFNGNISNLDLHKKRWKILNEAKEKPTIIHYITANKPWHKEFKNSIGTHFIDALKKSEWSDYKIKHKNKGIKILAFHTGRILRSIRNRIGY